MATVVQKTFPIAADGLCLDLKIPGIRPRIWLNADIGYHRKRFTLAHEIGHIVIPWHTGSVFDNLDAGDPSEATEYGRLEAEANRFAAELLMPKSWVSSICTRAEHMSGAMHTILELADVSKLSAALRAAQCGPSGYLVAGVRDGIVFWSGKTAGTKALLPTLGVPHDAFTVPDFFPPEVVGTGKTQYYWWQSVDASVARHRQDEPSHCGRGQEISGIASGFFED